MANDATHLDQNIDYSVTHFNPFSPAECIYVAARKWAVYCAAMQLMHHCILLGQLSIVGPQHYEEEDKKSNKNILYLHFTLFSHNVDFHCVYLYMREIWWCCHC